MPKPAPMDKIQQARRARERQIKLPDNGVELTLRRWNLDQITEYSGLFLDVIRDLAKSQDPKAVEKFLNARLEEILGQYRRNFYRLLGNTLVYDYSHLGGPTFFDNFKKVEQGVEFTETLGPGDLFFLIQELWKDNFLPLAGRLGLSGSPTAMLSQLLATKLPILLTSLSKQDTRTSK